MNDRRLAKMVALRMGSLGLALGALLAFALVLSVGAPKGLSAVSPLVVVESAVLVFLIAGAVLNTFAAYLRPSAERLAATVACALAAVATAAAAVHAETPLTPLTRLLIDVAVLAGFAFGCVKVLIAGLNVAGAIATHPPWIAAGLCVLTGVLALLGQNWIAMDELRRALPVVRDLGILLAPLFVLAACSLWAPLRLDPKSMRGSLFLRLDRGPSSRLHLRLLALTLCGATAGILLQLVWRRFAPIGLEMPGAALPVALGLVWFGLESGIQLAVDERRGQTTARLVTPSAKRFLRRHLTERPAWAATVGLKTTNFIIDHDPKGQLQNEIPTTLMQIRGDEIKRCVVEVLGPLFLHSHVVGHRIFGAIDPESSLRPCVDALKMFSCLYLDAGPLVERRIKGLTSLMPIIDPGLARMLDPDRLSDLIRRNLWFFHFDYGWIDQHVIHTPRDTRYDVHVATLSSRVRHSMLEHLEKTGGIGNFVWIGPEARDKLLQEAPMLKNIIEPCPIRTEDRHGGPGDERLMFIIKFEQLIPRLQRYFDFDTMRRSILDFEPSPEAQRLLTLLGLQAAKARTPEQIEDLLASLTSVPWRGFKEKDSALQLVLSCYKNLNATLGAEGALHESQDPQYREIHHKLLDAVRTIGYPSQILHHAQINKLALRDMDNLLKAASSPANPRFEEAWLLLATNDYRRHPLAQKERLLEFLGDVGRRRGLATQRLVQAKAIDALVALGSDLDDSRLDLLSSVLDRMARWLAETASVDICCHFLDAFAFLSEHLGKPLDLSTEAVSRFDAHLASLQGDMGASHPQIIAAMSRWQDYRTRLGGNASAA